MKFKRNVTMEIAWSILALCFLALTVAMFFVNTNMFIVVLCLTIAVVLLFSVRITQIRKSLATLITGIGTGMNATQQTILSTIQVPVLVTDSNKSVLWYNDSFRAVILKNKDFYLEDFTKCVPGFDLVRCSEEFGAEYVINSEHYRVFSTSSSHSTDTLYVTLFVNDTSQYTDAVQFKRTRPSVLVFTVDSYDELSGELKESERAELMSEVYRAMEDFINTTNGIFVRTSSRNYVAIIEEQHIEKIVEKRFSILDTVRSIQTESVPITMSIGVGRGAKTMYENYIQAHQALDMALGRGGDQAAMKTQNGYEFYGGTNRAVEKRNKVKSRIIASALSDLMHVADNVIVMGHKLSDLDSLGSAVGIARAAKISGTDVNIVFDSKSTLAKPLFDKLVLNGYGSLFVTPNEAVEHVDKDTLLVVVDCHVPSLVENSDILTMTDNIVIVDHHRKMVGHIENAVLSYHEPYASSCSELVAELLQHMETAENKPTKLEAEGMLAGIMLDSRDFSVRTGVRTFEAASYLRRLGAAPTEAKLFFSTDLATYKNKSELVASAQLYRGCAVIVSDKLPESMRVVIPQAADDLLNIDGISASIVAVKFQNKVHISSRSLGAYNVQLIMEHLGGGGHQTMAGVQLDDADLDVVKHLIYEAIDNYLDKNPPIK
ncbi:MAG: DHH family phosphoesterase [Oscillospiraceae bacterium]